MENKNNSDEMQEKLPTTEHELKIWLMKEDLRKLRWSTILTGLTLLIWFAVPYLLSLDRNRHVEINRKTFEASNSRINKKLTFATKKKDLIFST